MIGRILTIAATLALAAAPLAAADKEKPDLAESKAIELKNLATGKQKIDPAKAYIFVRSPLNRATGVFLKTPSAEEIGNYEREWQRQFDKAKVNYERDLKSYEAAKKAGQSYGAKPVEPKAETFSIPPLEMRMLVGFGPQYIFDKVDVPGSPKSFSYLVEVEPGEYTYLGPLFYLPGTPPAGTCFCMGSVKFEARAGEITSLGDFLSLGWADKALRAQSTVQRENLPDITPKPTDWSVPDTLAKYKVVQAPLRAAGKRNNFLNALVGRIPPVPGVLAYNRDIPVDLVGEAAEKAKAEPAPQAAPTPAPAP